MEFPPHFLLGTNHIYEIITPAKLTHFKQNSKKKKLKIIFTLPLHLTSCTAAAAKVGFWKKDGLVEEKNRRTMKKK